MAWEISLNSVDSDISSRPEELCKKCVLKNFSKFTGKHLCQSIFSNKVAGLQLKKILLALAVLKVKKNFPFSETVDTSISAD